MSEFKRTILYDAHVALGGSMVEFGGFLMPLYYTTIADEHHTIRNRVGMFDVSHMGEIRIKGKDALQFVNYLVTSHIAVSKKMQYGLLLYEHGTVVDDLMIYAISAHELMLVVNASNKDKDFEWIQKHAQNFNVEVIDESDATGEIALQGPDSENILKKLFTDYPMHSMEWDTYLFEGATAVISRSGYTGEDGFEIYGSPELIVKLWDRLYHLGVKPAGLGCRDTLRFEAAMPLYGHEIDDTINPLEAGLSFGIDLTKSDFIGKDALLSYQQNLKRKLVGIELLERNVARAHYEVYAHDQLIGYITTGYLSPSTNRPLGLALIDINHAKIGTAINVLIRNRMVPAIVRNKKFYDKKNRV